MNRQDLRLGSVKNILTFSDKWLVKKLIGLLIFSALTLHAFVATAKKVQPAKPASKEMSEMQCTTSAVDTSNFPDNRDQSNTSWCHAYVMADLMSFYSKKKISAYGIAAQYYKSASIDSRDGRVQTSFANTGGNPIQDFYHTQRSSNTLCTEANFTPDNGDWGLLSKNMVKLEKQKTPADRTCSQSFYVVTKGIDDNLLEDLNQLSNKVFLNAVIQKKCQNTTPLPVGDFLHVLTKYGWSYTNDGNSSAYRDYVRFKSQGYRTPANMLDKKLDRNEPVGVYYDADLLDIKAGQVNKNYNHFSTVIGRRFNQETKQCEYHLRNSWGMNCKQYAEKYQAECSDGNLWIPRADLLKSLGGVDYFEPRK